MFGDWRDVLARLERRGRISSLYRQLHGELEDRLRAGRRGDFGNCIAQEAWAAATVAAIEAEMAEHGYSAADAQALVANARRAVSAQFRQWEDAYVLNEAGKLAAREAHPTWFGREIAERMWRAWSIPFLETWRREMPKYGLCG